MGVSLPYAAMAEGRGKREMPQIAYGLVRQKGAGLPLQRTLCSSEHVSSPVSAEKGREHFFP